jgi:hypothetical protein
MHGMGMEVEEISRPERHNEANTNEASKAGKKA